MDAVNDVQRNNVSSFVAKKRVSKFRALSTRMFKKRSFALNEKAKRREAEQCVIIGVMTRPSPKSRTAHLEKENCLFGVQPEDLGK